MTTYYKFLDGDKSSVQGHPWHLPKGKRPGKWMPAVQGEIVLCENGYHGCREQASDMLEWCNAPDLYELELQGDIVEGDNKVAGRQARLLQRFETWNERTARLFACDCAERVAHLHPIVAPTIEIARRYANGEASREELVATRAAAWATARDAERAAERDATRAAAWAATWTAAGDAERAAEWDAAWATAGDVAGAAARDAAWAVTRAAAGAAAAGAAEREWQFARMMQYIRGEVG